MEIQLKQRLVGAVVLVSLGVIFIPMILPGNHSDSMNIAGSNIPPAPDYGFTPPPKPPPAPAVEKAAPIIESAEGSATKPKGKTLDQSVDSLIRKAIPQPAPEKQAEVKEGAAAAESAKASETTKATAGAKTTASTKASTSASAWIVQVGSFTSRDNAIALRDKIREQGHASFVEAVKGEKGMVYRVRVGPELTRELAEKLQASLQSKLKLKGMVLKYP